MEDYSKDKPSGYIQTKEGIKTPLILQDDGSLITPGIPLKTDRICFNFPVTEENRSCISNPSPA